MEENQLTETKGTGSNGKKLRKSRNKMLCGVCAGVANYFSVDPTLIRLITVFLVFAGVGSGLLAYIIAAIIMPEASEM